MAGRKKKKPSNDELLELAKKAREVGMSYGQYTAKLYMEEQIAMKRQEKIEKQIEYMKIACREAGLSEHITLFSKDIKPTAPAAAMAAEIIGRKDFPAKCSFMYCDELDMCFYYGSDGTARMAYSGETKAGSDDIKHNLVMAFKTAEKVLDKMQELSFKHK